MEDEDWQRIKNFALFKVWATDKELEDYLPFVGGVFLFIVIIAIFFAIVENL